MKNKVDKMLEGVVEMVHANTICKNRIRFFELSGVREARSQRIGAYAQGINHKGTVVHSAVPFFYVPGV